MDAVLLCWMAISMLLEAMMEENALTLWKGMFHDNFMIF